MSQEETMEERWKKFIEDERNFILGIFQEGLDDDKVKAFIHSELALQKQQDCRAFAEMIGKTIDGYVLQVYKNTSMGDVTFYKTEDVLQLLKNIPRCIALEKMKEEV